MRLATEDQTETEKHGREATRAQISAGHIAPCPGPPWRVHPETLSICRAEPGALFAQGGQFSLARVTVSYAGLRACSKATLTQGNKYEALPTQSSVSGTVRLRITA